MRGRLVGSGGAGRSTSSSLSYATPAARSCSGEACLARRTRRVPSAPASTSEPPTARGVLMPALAAARSSAATLERGSAPPRCDHVAT
jgi:hypothetical protein